jgi:hypothetical protein
MFDYERREKGKEERDVRLILALGAHDPCDDAERDDDQQADD